MASQLFEVFVAQQTNERSSDLKRQSALQSEHHLKAFNLAQAIIDTMLSEAPDLAIRYKIYGGDSADPEMTQTPFYHGAAPVGLAVRAYPLGEQVAEGDKPLPRGYDLMADVGPSEFIERDSHGQYASLIAPNGPQSIRYPVIGDRVVHGNGYNEAADLEVISFLGDVSSGLSHQIEGLKAA